MMWSRRSIEVVGDPCPHSDRFARTIPDFLEVPEAGTAIALLVEAGCPARPPVEDERAIGAAASFLSLDDRHQLGRILRICRKMGIG